MSSTNFMQAIPNDDEVCPNCADAGYVTVTMISIGPNGKKERKVTNRCYCGRGKALTNGELATAALSPQRRRRPAKGTAAKKGTQS